MTKQRISYQDLAMTYLVKGANAVALQVVTMANPGQALDRTIEAIAALDRALDTGDLADLRERFDTSTGEGRGRKALEVGSTRTYKAQQVGDGELFIRLPVSTLCRTKGTEIRVEALAGKLVVTVA